MNKNITSIASPIQQQLQKMTASIGRQGYQAGLNWSQGFQAGAQGAPEPSFTGGAVTAPVSNKGSLKIAGLGLGLTLAGSGLSMAGTAVAGNGNTVLGSGLSMGGTARSGAATGPQ